MASSNGADASKTALEASYLRALPTPVISSVTDNEGALDLLAKLDLWTRAQVVLLPVSDQGGISMTTLAKRAFAAGKRVGLCLNCNGVADCIEIFSEAELSVTERTIPKASSCSAEGDTLGFSCSELVESLCIVSGLVFDSQGYRVGEDDDKLDEFLAFYPGHKLALVRSMQISSNPLPHGDKAIAVDYLITENAVWHCG